MLVIFSSPFKFSKIVFFWCEISCEVWSCLQKEFLSAFANNSKSDSSKKIQALDPGEDNLNTGQRKSLYEERIIGVPIFGSNSRRVQIKALEKDATLKFANALDIARNEKQVTK